MTLYTLFGGRSKKRMKPLETNSREKCEKYRDALKATPTCIYKWFDIRLAEAGATVKEHKSKNKWTNYNSPLVPRVPRKK